MMHFVFEAKHAQDFAASIRIVSAVAVNAFGETQISFSRQRWKKIESLKDKTNFSPANVCALGVRGGGQVFTVDDDASACRGQQSTHQVQHCRLTAT